MNTDLFLYCGMLISCLLVSGLFFTVKEFSSMGTNEKNDNKMK